MCIRDRYILITISVTTPVTFNKETWCDVLVATKENHTSSFTPEAPQLGAGAVDCVAETVLLLVNTAQLKSGFTVSEIAPVQSSLAGGGGGVATHISKVALLLELDGYVHTRK